MHLHTLHGKVQARRLRNDSCTIKTSKGDVAIGSYIETGVLDLETKEGNVTVGKKLGINKNGTIKTKSGNISLGSIFSLMAHLPTPLYV